eukprot:TRINITY_DN610_c0_g1_i7.p1 TRINITY_DN610_c0_g1~~TRINITY_DN610_c0_g1_i7.p1  ORF type:complete len:314 (-),score=35.91 TRINITY_DN610_c0_g1_i7:511-1452(-)
MVCAHSVVVKNTFINVLEDDEQVDDGFVMQTRTRTLSDPLPQLSSKHSTVHTHEIDLEEVGDDAKAFALDSPRTSVGDSDSESGLSSHQEWSPIDTPVNSPRPALLLYPSLSPPDAASIFCLPPAIDQPVEPKHLDIPSEWHGKTSVMVRNISYKCCRMTFSEALDKAGYKNLFDYVYVPINSVRATSKGYAFVNFVDDRTAYRFKNQFEGRKMDVPGSFKLLEIIPANLQGYSQNSTHYIAKQSELTAASNTHPAQMSHFPMKLSQVEKSKGIVSEERRQSRDECQKYSNCHQCRRQVLTRARFCHWCGAGL